MSRTKTLTAIQIDSFPFQVQAVDKNAPGVTAYSSNTLGRIFTTVVIACNGCNM